MHDIHLGFSPQAKHYTYHESNNAVAVPTIELFISNVPKPLRWAAKWAAYSLMDPFLLKTMGLPQVNDFVLSTRGWNLEEGRGLFLIPLGR